MESISTEIRYLTLQRQKLLKKHKLLCMNLELRNRLKLEHTEKSAHSQQEVDQIGEKLKQLSAKKAELKKKLDELISAENIKKEEGSPRSVTEEPDEKTDSGVANSGKDVFSEESPTIPDPDEDLDVENLGRCPCKTQCPQCRAVVVTETISSISDVTWLMCISTAAVGCVAGCCLIPFCFDRFKSTTHKCPMCRSTIKTI
ncbi:unnamed protein product [Ophioblennius macclurei]